MVWYGGSWLYSPYAPFPKLARKLAKYVAKHFGNNFIQGLLKASWGGVLIAALL